MSNDKDQLPAKSHSAEIDAFLRGEAGHGSQQQNVRRCLEPEANLQCFLVGALAAQRGCIVSRGDQWIIRRIPDGRVNAIQYSREPIAARCE